jgi:tetratricopeptide (TPR) repeat protein
VKFNFYLHRKGMVKDTVHTTVVDSTYTRGVMALKDMDYDTAIPLLAPYNDYNAAVAYIGKDRNLSALQILEPMEKTPQVNYLLAIIYSRIGEVQKAVQCYMTSVEQEPSYRHRGNLDPEISVLIKQYGLFKEEEEIVYW